jgi:hypothetical protein
MRGRLHYEHNLPTNLDGYGTPPIEWQRVRDVLTSEITQGPDAGGPNRHTVWLTTINPDGSPHVTPVGFVQLDGVWYFTSGPGTRKSRNLAADPRCVVSVATIRLTWCLRAAWRARPTPTNCVLSRMNTTERVGPRRSSETP